MHATLFDEGCHLGSVRSMYRVLAAHGGTRERHNQLVHPAYTKPELLAIAPNQVWSWDITKLKGPAKWTCFHLYVILDNLSKHGQTSFSMSGRQRPSQIRSHHFRINVLLPNRLSTRSTATIAVALRTSSAGFSSMMSSEARAPVSAIISMQSWASR